MYHRIDKGVVNINTNFPNKIIHSVNSSYRKDIIH